MIIGNSSLLGSKQQSAICSAEREQIFATKQENYATPMIVISSSDDEESAVTFINERKNVKKDGSRKTKINARGSSGLRKVELN